MINWGKVPLASVLPFPFGTYGKTNGESITLTGLAVTDIEVYKGTSMTQRASDAGYALMDTDGIDIDGITGIHGFSIDTGDNTDAGFFVAGSFYTVIVSAVTVDSQTVNFVAGSFWLGPTLSVAGVDEVDVTHWLGTAAATPTVAGVPEVDVTHWIGTAAATPTTAGVPEVDVTFWLGTAAQGASGRPQVDIELWNGTAVTTPPAVNATQFAGQTITAAAGVTLPASVASPTNITAGTITTVTNLTNAPTAGDLTATMKTSVTTAATAATPVAASVTGAVGSVTGAVGSVTAAVTVGTNNDKTGYALSATLSAAMTEGYAALGAAPTLGQALYEIRGLLAEKAVAGTTLTINGLDGVTPKATYTLNDATTPTAITRAS